MQDPGGVGRCGIDPDASTHAHHAPGSVRKECFMMNCRMLHSQRDVILLRHTLEWLVSSAWQQALLARSLAGVLLDMSRHSHVWWSAPVKPPTSMFHVAARQFLPQAACDTRCPGAERTDCVQHRYHRCRPSPAESPPGQVLLPLPGSCSGSLALMARCRKVIGLLRSMQARAQSPLLMNTATQFPASAWCPFIPGS